MAELLSVTAPLAIRYPDGVKHIMIWRSSHTSGLLYLRPFWNQVAEEKTFTFAAGPIKGDGPWKVGNAVVTVLGCHGTDAELATEFSSWQILLEQMGDAYPSDQAIESLADEFAQRYLKY
ncbi:MAG: hypothetical protein V3V12_02200 [Gammaproteobacteria bacterium]